MDKLKLLMGRPLTISEEYGIFVHQPLVSEIVDFGEDIYNNLVLPFTLTTEAVFSGAKNEEELVAQYHIFDLFFIDIGDGNTLLDGLLGGNATDILISSLQYFLKVDDIKPLKQRRKLVVNGEYLIDKKEFEEIKLAIQAVTTKKDIEIEKPPKNMRSKRRREIWKKLQEGRRRDAEKKAIFTQDIINYSAFGGSSFIPYREFDRMTYYQLINTYKSVMGKDAFDVSMGYKLSQKFEVKDDVKHWTEALKIGK